MGSAMPKVDQLVLGGMPARLRSCHLAQ